MHAQPQWSEWTLCEGEGVGFRYRNKTCVTGKEKRGSKPPVCVRERQLCASNGNIQLTL